MIDQFPVSFLDSFSGIPALYSLRTAYITAIIRKQSALLCRKTVTADTIICNCGGLMMEKSDGSKGRSMLRRLSQHYRIHKVDIGEDARMAKRGFVFVTRTYEIEDVGHLCIMNMKAMFGLMRMETVILASTKKDMPLMNLDWVQVPGKQTLLGELYDTQLTPWPEESQAAFAKISDRDHDLPDYSSGSEHWYDSLLYPCSYHKTGRGIGSRLESAAADFSTLFISQLAEAPACDEEAKKALTEAFAQKLAANGGSAVNLFTKLFGQETADRMIMNHMYGVR